MSTPTLSFRRRRVRSFVFCNLQRLLRTIDVFRSAGIDTGFERGSVVFAPRFEARITESVADKRVEHVWCIDDDEQLEACMSFIDYAIAKLKAARELHDERAGLVTQYATFAVLQRDFQARGSSAEAESRVAGERDVSLAPKV